MLTNRNRSLIPLATVFIVWLCVFSTYGNAAASSNVYTQPALEATSGTADAKYLPGFPISIGDTTGGGGWLRIWTPFGWITIGGGGGGGGDNHGRFQPFVPTPVPPKPNLPPQPSIPTPQHPSNPVTPNPSKPPPCNPVTPNPSNPATPKPFKPTPSNPVTPNPSNPVTPNPFKPTPSNPVTPNPSNPVAPNPFKPTPGSSRPPLPPWLSPYIGGGGGGGRVYEPPPPPPYLPKWLAPYIGSDGYLHFPDRPSHPIPKWLAPYVGKGKPPQRLTPPHHTTNSMATRSEATSKTPAQERHHYYQCWSSLEKVDKCVNEILTAFSSRKFQVLGSACCSAIEKMNKDCHARTIGNFHDHFFSASVHRHCSAN